VIRSVVVPSSSERIGRLRRKRASRRSQSRKKGVAGAKGQAEGRTLQRRTKLSLAAEDLRRSTSAAGSSEHSRPPRWRSAASTASRPCCRVFLYDRYLAILNEGTEPL
jgi:hypothetical protein